MCIIGYCLQLKYYLPKRFYLVLPIMLSYSEILFSSDVTGDDIWPDIELVLLFKKKRAC